MSIPPPDIPFRAEVVRRWECSQTEAHTYSVMTFRYVALALDVQMSFNFGRTDVEKQLSEIVLE